MPDPTDMPDDDSQDPAPGDHIAGDGLPGVPVDGWPGVRAGAFGSGSGLLGIVNVKQPHQPVTYDPNAAGCPGPYDTRTMEVTGYTSGPESTGKRPGDPGYGIGAYNTPVGPGSIAAQHSQYDQGVQMYVPGYGLGTVNDTGGAIKGDRLDLWFPTVDQAKAWGRQRVDVEVCKPPQKNSSS